MISRCQQPFQYRANIATAMIFRSPVHYVFITITYNARKHITKNFYWLQCKSNCFCEQKTEIAPCLRTLLPPAPAAETYEFNSRFFASNRRADWLDRTTFNFVEFHTEFLNNSKLIIWCNWREVRRLMKRDLETN